MELQSALLPEYTFTGAEGLYITCRTERGGAPHIIMAVLSAVRLLPQRKQFQDELLITDWIPLIKVMQDDSTFEVRITRR